MGSASPGSPLLSFTRDLEKSAERAGTAGQTQSSLSDPLNEAFQEEHEVDLAPLPPGTILHGEASSTTAFVDVLTPTQIIREGAANLQTSVDLGNFLDGEKHSQNILVGVSKNTI